jgi:hypothetical protein
MRTLLPEAYRAHLDSDIREFILVWQNPNSRRFLRAGSLVIADELFEFRYERAALEDEDFFPLDEFPVVDKVYKSRQLPAFFANRIMSSERGSYERYLGWLGLAPTRDDVPIEILIRTGGSRATDTFHIVERPLVGASHFISRFFVSGIRHQASESLIRSISDGDDLLLESQPHNVHNANAHLVLKSRDEPIGWVPDWLCDEISEMARDGWHFRVSAERINPDAPSHIQVLCRLEADRVLATD